MPPRPQDWRPGSRELSSCCVCLGNQGDPCLCPCLHPKAEVARPEHFQAGIFRKCSSEIKGMVPSRVCPTASVMPGH